MQKKYWLIIAVMAIGIVVLPQTIAMFAGQHNWYDTTQAGSQIPCEKCHADISNELSQPGTVNLMHKVMGCDQCHVTTAPNSEGFVQGPGGQFHAAATTSCIDCHGDTLLYGTFDHVSIVPLIQSGQLGCTTCHKGAIPGNFSATSIFNGPEEVHKAFANDAKNSSLLKDGNEACISCHTHIKVDIIWKRATVMEFRATEQVTGGGDRTWIIDGFNATGTNITNTSG
jgi:hypothetical protein